MRKFWRKPETFPAWLTLSLVVLVTVSVIRVMAGTTWFSFEQLFDAITGTNSANQFILLQLRLPAIVGAMSIGVALATAGSLLRTVTRNPLADPGVLGVSSGAVFTIVLAYVVAGSSLSAAGLTTPIFGFIGALATAFLMLKLATVHGEIDSNRMLLVGIGFSLFFGSLTTYLKSFLNAENFNVLTALIQGNLDTVTWSTILTFAPIILLVFIGLLFFHRYLQVLALGREAAIGIGFDYAWWKRIFLILAVLLTAISLLFGGAISFLGILGSQIGARLAPHKLQHQLILGAIWSAILVIVADFCSRQLFGFIVPLDTMIAFIGAPAFLYVLLQRPSMQK